MVNNKLVEHDDSGSNTTLEGTTDLKGGRRTAVLAGFLIQVCSSFFTPINLETRRKKEVNWKKARTHMLTLGPIYRFSCLAPLSPVLHLLALRLLDLSDLGPLCLSNWNEAMGFQSSPKRVDVLWA